MLGPRLWQLGGVSCRLQNRPPGAAELLQQGPILSQLRAMLRSLG